MKSAAFFQEKSNQGIAIPREMRYSIAKWSKMEQKR